jgi:hypothetical protein
LYQFKQLFCEVDVKFPSSRGNFRYGRSTETPSTNCIRRWVMGDVGVVGYRQAIATFGTAAPHSFRFAKALKPWFCQLNLDANLVAANDDCMRRAA